MFLCKISIQKTPKQTILIDNMKKVKYFKILD